MELSVDVILNNRAFKYELIGTGVLQMAIEEVYGIHSPLDPTKLLCYGVRLLHEIELPTSHPGMTNRTHRNLCNIAVVDSDQQIYAFSRVKQWSTTNRPCRVNRSNRKARESNVRRDKQQTVAAINTGKVSNTVKSMSPTTNYSTLFPPFIFRTINKLEDHPKEKSYVIGCQQQNKSYKQMLYNDHSCLDFVSQQYPEFLDVYTTLPRKVMKADMWRLLILHHYGGVYLDMDCECKKPIDEWGESFGISKQASGYWEGDPERIQLMVGVEIVNDAQITNWAIAAKPGHPILYEAVKMIAEEQSSNSSANDTEVLYLTGPKLFTAAIIRHLVGIGYFSNDDDATVRNATFWQNNNINTLIEEVGLAVLNKQAFGFHRLHKSSPLASSKEIFVRHWFQGRWRGSREK